MTVAAATAGPPAILTAPVTRFCATETELRSDCVQQGASLACGGPSSGRPLPCLSANRCPGEGYQYQLPEDGEEEEFDAHELTIRKRCG